MSLSEGSRVILRTLSVLEGDEESPVSMMEILRFAQNDTCLP